MEPFFLDYLEEEVMAKTLSLPFPFIWA